MSDTTWTRGQIKQFASTITGSTPPKKDEKNYGNDFLFVKPPDLQNTVVRSSKESISHQGAKVSRTAPENAILVTCIGNLGRVGITDREVGFNQQINAIIPSSQLLPKYVFYFAQSPYFRNQLEALASSTTIPIVNKGKFSTIEISFPEKTRQEKIVAKIEELFSEIDKAREDLRLSLQLCESLKKSYLQKAYYIDPDAENVQIKDFASVKGGKRLPKGEKYSDIETSHPYIRVVDFDQMSVSERDLKYISERTHSMISRYTISSDDLYISIAGTIGRVGTISEGLSNANLTENAAKITNIKDFDKDYLCLALNSPAVQHQIKTLTVSTSQPKLALFRAEQIEVLRPSIEVQVRTVNEVKAKLSQIEKLKEDLTSFFKLSEVQKETILNKAFKGELV